jgi:protein TonB
MFEGSLVESRGLSVSGTQKWTALGSLTVQVGLAGLLLAIPMWRPEVLPMMSRAPRVALPVMSKPPVMVQAARTTSSVPSGVSMPAAAVPVMESGHRLIFNPHGERTDGPAPTLLTGVGMPGGTGPLVVLGGSYGTGFGAAPRVVRERTVGPVRVSSGVSAGMLLAPIRPVYPAIAKAAGVQGAVVLEAVISKAGRIESLHAVSGPAMLRPAALDAVQAARYAPYKLNGEATEVQTTITVVFALGR